MSTHALIGLEQGRRDLVTAVITPMDGVTRVLVRSGLDIKLWDQAAQRVRPAQLVRNLSGQTVLLNESRDQHLTFRILTRGTFYRGPVVVTFNPAQDALNKVVALERRPDAPFDDVATLVRGVVVRARPGGPDGLSPEEGVRVSATVMSRARQFPVTTDARGAFALSVEVRPPGPDELPTVEATLLFEKDGLPSRTITARLRHGRVHVFAAPVDVGGAGRARFHHEPDTEAPAPDEPDR